MKHPHEVEEEDCEPEESEFRRKKRLAFLDLLLEAYDKGEISREGVREEVDTFMFEVSAVEFYLIELRSGAIDFLKCTHFLCKLTQK